MGDILWTDSILFPHMFVINMFNLTIVGSIFNKYRSVFSTHTFLPLIKLCGIKFFEIDENLCASREAGVHFFVCVDLFIYTNETIQGVVKCE